MGAGRCAASMGRGYSAPIKSKSRGKGKLTGLVYLSERNRRHFPFGAGPSGEVGRRPRPGRDLSLVRLIPRNRTFLSVDPRSGGALEGARPGKLLVDRTTATRPWRFEEDRNGRLGARGKGGLNRFMPRVSGGRMSGSRGPALDPCDAGGDPGPGSSAPRRSSR